RARPGERRLAPPRPAVRPVPGVLELSDGRVARGRRADPASASKSERSCRPAGSRPVGGVERPPVRPAAGCDLADRRGVEEAWAGARPPLGGAAPTPPDPARDSPAPWRTDAVP